jgi:NAD(P)-dependent dehydrogenase (short-subunit alcohol dehydrogenase family)
MDFDGKVLFATGGASGIAAATARRFTAGGGRVAVVDLDAGRAQEAAGGIEGAIGLGADVADEASVKAAVDATIERLGRIDCVLNAAGHAEFGPLETWSLEAWNRMMSVHAGGTFLVCKHVLPLMREQGGAGSIVNIASTAALTANQNNTPYGAAKGAIISFSRQLAREAAPDIRVNTVAPGRVRTGMTEPLVAQRSDSVEEGFKRFGMANLQQRVAGADELAAPICFLLSDGASFITGTLLVVDGGETAL